MIQTKENVMKFVKLGDIVKITSGGTPSKNKIEYYEHGDIPWIKTGDLKVKELTVVNDFITELGLNNSSAKLFPINTVLVAMYGATIGACSIMKIEASTNQACAALLPSDKANHEYLYFYLKSIKQKLINQGVGGGQPNISATILKNTDIWLPDYQTQLHIANILSKAESLIAQRKESIRLLDEYLKSVFLEMFGDKEYRKEKLGTVIYIQSGQVNPNELPYSEMYHVGGANIESDTGKIFNLKKAKSENLISGKYYFEEDFILYSKIRPYLNKVATPDFKGICSADIYPIKPNSDLLKKDYLRFVLMSEEFLTYTASQSDRTNIPKVNRKALDNFNISIPPIEFQIKFAQIVEKTEALKAQYQQSLQELENLYGSLSQKAFKGELSIKDESLLMAAEPEVDYGK